MLIELVHQDTTGQPEECSTALVGQYILEVHKHGLTILCDCLRVPQGVPFNLQVALGAVFHAVVSATQVQGAPNPCSFLKQQ